jgi:glutathionylspermidine synthase
MLLSNKGILPLLWQKYPNHPNLLPAFFETDTSSTLGAGWVRKPLYSREGANIELVDHQGQRLKVDGPYSDSGFIRQAFHALPKFGDSYTLIGSWLVGDSAAGIGIREDNSLITKDSSRFLPHIILD